MPKEIKKESKNNIDKIIKYKGKDGTSQYALNGNRFSFLSKSIKAFFRISLS